MLALEIQKGEVLTLPLSAIISYLSYAVVLFEKHTSHFVMAIHMVVVAPILVPQPASGQPAFLEPVPSHRYLEGLTVA